MSFDREQLLKIYDVTEEDMAALNEDGYMEARDEANRLEADFLRRLQLAADAIARELTSPGTGDAGIVTFQWRIGGVDIGTSAPLT